MWHYVFATHSLLLSLMQASIRTGCHIITLCKIANTIAILIKWKPSFLLTLLSHAPHHPFQRSRKNKAFLVLAMCLIKCSFITFHSVTASYRKFAFTSLHYIQFTPYFKHRTARVFRASYTCFFTTLQRICMLYFSATYSPIPSLKMNTGIIM